jgi:hypothetical protein
MDWLQANTPEGSVVLAPWSLGHHLIYLAGRKPVVTPFIFDRSTPGLEDSIRFYLLDTPEEAMARARRLGIRYVIVTDLSRDAERWASFVGSENATAFAEEREGRKMSAAGSVFRGTMAGRLFLDRPDQLPAGFNTVFELPATRRGIVVRIVRIDL